ncbi:hypothetical protein RR42_s1484 [Cupriavidus basilensis]|uniref:Uncharacterized protein n=1 Tax=Cupriavidus basilensis TaxID=68895 RepID=A0A0C4YBV9_9BURK|nr:hypothetical protein RR42_s1484 [Cupriavidus basilensis]
MTCTCKSVAGHTLPDNRSLPKRSGPKLSWHMAGMTTCRSGAAG